MTPPSSQSDYRETRRLTNAQRVSVGVIRSLAPALAGPFEMYPGAEHYEVVTMVFDVPGQKRREFMVAPGGCVSEMLR